MPEELRGMYWANIGLFGGLGYIEALGERLYVTRIIAGACLGFTESM